MLDLTTLKVNDRVRLRLPMAGLDAGALGTVVKTLTAHEPDGRAVPAVIVSWDEAKTGRSSPSLKRRREGFTQHEQAVHGILERVEESSTPTWGHRV